MCKEKIFQVQYNNWIYPWCGKNVHHRLAVKKSGISCLNWRRIWLESVTCVLSDVSNAQASHWTCPNVLARGMGSDYSSWITSKLFNWLCYSWIVKTTKKKCRPCQASGQHWASLLGLYEAHLLNLMKPLWRSINNFRLI